jgi:hypothetical protein
LLQLNQQTTSSEELNGFINNTPIYVTSLTATENLNNNPTGSSKSESGVGGGVLANTISVVATKEVITTPKLLPNGHEPSDFILPQQLGKVANDVRAAEVKESPTQALEVRKLGDRRASSPFQNGRTELLIGAEDNKFKTTAIVESNNNKLGVDPEAR